MKDIYIYILFSLISSQLPSNPPNIVCVCLCAGCLICSWYYNWDSRRLQFKRVKIVLFRIGKWSLTYWQGEHPNIIYVHMYIGTKNIYIIPALFCLPSLFQVDQFGLFETILIIFCEITRCFRWKKPCGTFGRMLGRQVVGTSLTCNVFATYVPCPNLMVRTIIRV